MDTRNPAHALADEAAAKDEPFVRMEDLGQLIFAKRKTDRLTLEQAARQCGVGAATLWRLEQQWKKSDKSAHSMPEPDTRTLAAVTRWLGISIERVVTSPVGAAESVVHHKGDSTADMVEAHLRADRKLDAESASALGRIFRLAYEQMQRPIENSSQDGQIAANEKRQRNK